MRTLWALWMRVTHARRMNREFESELESHIRMHTEDGVRAGLSEAEARRRALLRLGGAEQARQAYRERAALPAVETLMQDLRYALRGFRHSPAFALTGIIILALGIGTTTAVFSVVDRILFRPLPYAHGDRLVSFGLSQSMERQEFTLGGFFYEWRDNQKPFESVTFERGVNGCNLTEQNPVQLLCGRIAANFLPTLGVSPAIGRNILPEEDVPGGLAVALISDSLWLRRFNRDRGVLGRTLNLDGRSTRIIGVLPGDFEMPRLQQFDLLQPAQTDIAAQHTVNAGVGNPMWAFARLRPGISVAEAKAQMEPLFRHTQLWIPPQIRSDFHLQVRSLRDRQMQDAYAAAWVLLGSVLVVLLIACGNVACLFSARAVSRAREQAVRAALGASRSRLARQTLTEALLLACVGAVIGVVLALALLRAFVAIAPTGVPLISNAHLDLRILAFTAAITAACALLFGIAPSLRQPGPMRLMSRATVSREHARLRQTLVALQIAMSVVLLSSATLLVKSFRNLETQSLGMQTRNVLVLRTALAPARYTSPQAYMDFYLRVEDALRRVPGITAVGISDSVPPDANAWHSGTRLADLVEPGGPLPTAGPSETVLCRSVTPAYFQALQIPIVEGRGFTESQRSTDDNPMILSRALASRLFPGVDAVGEHLQAAAYRPNLVLDGPISTVVGIAADVKNAGLAGTDDPELYTLRRNRPSDWNSHDVVLLETMLPPAVVTPWIRAQIAQLDPTAPVDIQPLTQEVARLADRPRFETALLAFFAITGLLMAIVGLYGVMTYTTLQRTQEIGVRVAVGAGKSDILRLICSDGLRVILAGSAVGLAAALALSRVLRTLLFHVAPYDPATYSAVFVLLVIVAFAATLLPARRAMQTDPMTVLRVD